MLRNRRRWVVATFVMIITAIAYVDRVNLSIAAPVLTKEFHTNAAVMGLLLSSFTWTYTLLNLPAGMLVDRVRTRVVYSAALLLWAVSSFLTALVNSVGTLFGPRLLLGVGEAPFAPAAIRTLSDWLPRSERGMGGSMFISGVALGSAVGPPILAWLVTDYGWRSCFIATGALSLLVAIIWYAWYRHPSEDRRLSDEERQLIVSDQEPYQQEGRAPWGAIVKQREIWAITGGYFCLLYILYTFITWVPSYLVQDRHMTILKSGFATSVPWICAFAVGILAGRTSDIALRRGMSALNARKVVLVTGMVAALAILGTAFATSATVAIICLAISTSGIIFANGAVWAATQDVTRSLNLSGSATGFINAMGNVGGILGPIVTGALAYATSSFVVPLVVAAALALIGALTWLFGMRARPGTVVPGGSGDSGAAGSGGAGGSGAEVTA
jgi:ACS family D-galactonate transporter-like MFS transporter